MCSECTGPSSHARHERPAAPLVEERRPARPAPPARARTSHPRASGDGPPSARLHGVLQQRRPPARSPDGGRRGRPAPAPAHRRQPSSTCRLCSRKGRGCHSDPRPAPAAYRGAGMGTRTRRSRCCRASARARRAPAPTRAEPTGLHSDRRQGRSPEPSAVSSVVRETELPVFVRAAPQRLLDHDRRRADAVAWPGRGLPRLWRGRGLLRLPRRRPGASTRRSASSSPASLPGVPWTFHRAIDAALEPRRAWRRLAGLPGLARWLRRGRRRASPRLRRAAGPPRPVAGIGELLMPAGGLRPSTCRGSSVPACGSSRSGRRCDPAGPSAPTSTPRSSGRGGCCWTTSSDREPDRSRGGPPAPDGSARTWILIDPPAAEGHGRLWSHLASDTSLRGAPRLRPRARTSPSAASTATTTTSRRSGTTRWSPSGATPVTSRELVTRLDAAGLRRRKPRP